jgi:hypothetical protein
VRDGNLAKVTGFKKTEKAKRLQKIVRNRCKKGKKLNSRAHTHTHTELAQWCHYIITK